MGLRTEGLLSALVIPLLLTMILFLGPLSVQLTNGIWKIYSGECQAVTSAYANLHLLLSFSISRADVLGELLSEPSMAAKSRCGSFVRRIHVSRNYDAVAVAKLLAHDVNLHHSFVLRCWYV